MMILEMVGVFFFVVGMICFSVALTLAIKDLLEDDS